MKANNVYSAALVAFATVTILSGCAMTDSVGQSGSGAKAAFQCGALDTLEDIWEVGPPSSGTHFQEEDLYRIEKKNDKYYLVVTASMSNRDEWKKHKQKKFKLTETTVANCTYLCADGIKLSKHADGAEYIDKDHVIMFLPPHNGKSQIAYEHKDGSQTCATLDTHGGRAHGQN